MRHMSYPLNNQEDLDRFFAAVRAIDDPERAKIEDVTATVREHPEWKEANILADALKRCWTEIDDWREGGVRFMATAGPLVELRPGESKVVAYKPPD